MLLLQRGYALPLVLEAELLVSAVFASTFDCGPCASSCTSSKDPESQASPCGRSTPRWSVLGGGQAPSATRSTAGLSGRRAMVWVGPPLSARPAGSRRGSVLAREPVSGVKPQESASSMLWPPSVTSPEQFPPEMLLATMALRRVDVAPPALPPPPSALLPALV